MKQKIKEMFSVKEKNEIYSKVFIVCYLLFSLYFLLINVVRNTTIEKIASIVSLVVLGILFYFFRDKKIRINKYLIIVLIVIPVLSRAGLLFLDYYNIESDYEFFLENARSYRLGEAINSGYISIFPYLYPYVKTLGFAMKIFGDGYNVVIGLNIFFDLVTAFLVYKIAKGKKGNSIGVKALLFYLYNPLFFLWIAKCCPVVIVNTFITLTIYLFMKLDFKKKNYIILSILIGLVCSIANSYRPIMIIFIIAVLVYYLYKILKKEDVKNVILSFIFILIVYVFSNRLILMDISRNIDIDVTKAQSGYTMLVGSNMESHGTWNKNDSDTFYKLLSTYGIDEASEKARKMAFDRYKSYGIIHTFELFVYKTHVLAQGVDDYSVGEVYYSIKTELPYWLKISIVFFAAFSFFIIIYLNLLTSLKRLNYKSLDISSVIPIFAMGLSAAMLLVEVSPRYFMPVLIPLVIYISCNFNVTKEKNQKSH